MVSDAAKKKAMAKKLNKTAKFQGKDAANAQAANMSHSAVRTTFLRLRLTVPPWGDRSRALRLLAPAGASTGGWIPSWPDTLLCAAP